MKQVRYTAEQKRWAIEQMKSPLDRTVAQLAKETGITEVSLRTWRDAARATGEFVPAGQASERWSGGEKFRVVLQSAALSEEEMAAYCRAKGILPEQVQQWRQACEQANESGPRVDESGRVVNPDAQEKIRHLERELRRKNEALAETAALLVLRKKAHAIWDKGEDA
jgi:transposase-like protein